MKMSNPCGPHFGFQRIVCCFLEQLIIDHNSRAATVRGYILDSINLLFELRNFPVPVDFNDSDNIYVKFHSALDKEEVVAKQRSPITKEMFAALILRGKEANANSIIAVVYDWFCIIYICGFRCAEYAQTKQTTVDIHQYPSGTQVIKAFTSFMISRDQLSTA
jgi:hypothetical protein